MKKMRLLLIGVLIAFVIGLLRIPVLRAITASYQETIRIVDSAGTVIGGVASAVTGSYQKTVRVVDSTGHVLDAFGPGAAGTYPSGSPPQVGGFSAANTPEAETVSGDGALTRAGANSYTVQVTATHLAAALPVAQGGSGAATLTGALKGNGTSAFTQAACADLSNGATGCSTATGTSGATIPLNNGNNALSGTNTAVTQTQGDASTDLATDAFVATAIAGQNPAIAANESTTGVLPNTPAYVNGAAGIGATLISTSFGALTLDGIATTVGDRVLIKNQASALQNGLYTVTATGGGAAFYTLTRALDYDTPGDITGTGTIPVISGTANAGTSWLLTSAVATVGTDAVTYTQFTYALAKTLNTSTAPFAGTLTATSTRYLKGDGTNWNTSSGAASGTGACSANQWASTLNGDAAPTCTQPAFSNLSGSATGAQLPNPSSSTLGGIQSLAAVSSNWINTISTSGVPSATRPACADLSNSAASCSTDTTSATNITSGTLSTARVGSIASGLTGVLPLANGGSGSATPNLPNTQYLTSGTTYTTPTGCTQLELLACAGGGGGGGSTTGGSTACTGAGGGSGACLLVTVPSPSGTYSYTIGAAGTAGTNGASPTAGGNGVATTFIVGSTTLTVNKGNGGGTNNAACNAAPAGGTAGAIPSNNTDNGNGFSVALPQGGVTGAAGSATSTAAKGGLLGNAGGQGGTVSAAGASVIVPTAGMAGFIRATCYGGAQF